VFVLIVSLKDVVNKLLHVLCEFASKRRLTKTVARMGIISLSSISHSYHHYYQHHANDDDDRRRRRRPSIHPSILIATRVSRAKKLSTLICFYFSHFPPKEQCANICGCFCNVYAFQLEFAHISSQTIVCRFKTP